MMKPYVLWRFAREFDNEFDRTGHPWFNAGTGTGFGARLMPSRWLTSLLALNLTLAASAADGAELDPAALAYKLPDQLQWRDPTGAAGVNQVILQGDPTKPGLYVVLNRFKPGNFSRPHFHPKDRFITVVKGTWWVATGNKFDPATETVPMPAGSFVTHFANEVHWDGAKDEETWVLIVGDGPGTSTRVEEAK
jgi:quercetin dioxygenase-like cupin family protein